jgi:hypothetical protein
MADTEHGTIKVEAVSDWNDKYDSFGVKVGDEWWNSDSADLLKVIEKGKTYAVEYTTTGKGKHYIKTATAVAGSGPSSAKVGGGSAESIQMQVCQKNATLILVQMIDAGQAKFASPMLACGELVKMTVKLYDVYLHDKLVKLMLDGEREDDDPEYDADGNALPAGDEDIPF